MKGEIGYSDTPVKKASFNEKTKTLTVEVQMQSTYTVNYKTGPVSYKNGEAGTTKVFDSSKGDGVRGASTNSTAIASKIGNRYREAGLRPERVVIKETYVSPTKWKSVQDSYEKKWRKKYGK